MPDAKPGWCNCENKQVNPEQCPLDPKGANCQCCPDCRNECVELAAYYDAGGE